MNASANLNYTDEIYQEILWLVSHFGDFIEGRNASTKTCIDLPTRTFTSTPLVTIRKTAWKLALKEMEWFMSGEEQCPKELERWWDGQLNPIKGYTRGYSSQLRHFGCHGSVIDFDQIKFLVNGLKSNPNSRRLLLTTWNPYDMAHITEFNNNPKTPTCCHTSLAQFFVRNEKLYLTSYQRSADLLLGVPHNWIQSWAMLLWFAHRTDLQVGSLRWIFGDAHIYQVESHLSTVEKLLIAPIPQQTFRLVYQPQTDDSVFRASDFVMVGDIPEPIVLTKPELL